MNTQTRLFYEDEFEAMASMIASSGKAHKECAAFLWPEMKLTSAIAKLHACLDRNGDERLKFGQVLALMNFCGHYDPLYYACDELMHARPDRKAPRDDELKLMEAINSAADVMNRAMAQLERMRGRA